MRDQPVSQAQQADPGPRTQTEALARVRLKARATVDREGELLARLSRTRSAQQIMTICDQLGYIGGAASVLELKKLTRDRRYGVAGNAQMALGRIGGPDAVDHLLTLVDGTPPYPANEAQALALTGDSRALDRLMELALEPSNLFQRHAIIALGEVGGPEVYKLFRTLLDQSDNTIREAIVTALGSMDGEESKDLLIELAQSDEAQIRRLAISALSDVSDDSTLPLLRAAIEGDDMYAAQYALQALATRGDDSDIQPILKAALSGSHQKRYAATNALASIGGPKAVKALTQLLQSSDANLPSLAATGLIAEGSPAAISAVTRAAAGASGRRRLEFMQAMSGSHDPAVAEFFAGFARDADPEVRVQALQHLAQMHDPRAEPLALQALESGSPRERQTAIQLLSSLGTEGARQALLDLAQSGKQDASTALMYMSERFSDGELVELMGKRFTEGNSSDAQNAMYALLTSGDARAREVFMQALRGDNPDRAGLAIQALNNFGMDDQTRELLVDIARSTKDSGLKNQALSAVIRSGSPEALRLASEMVHGSDADVATSALQSLYESSHPRALELVRSAADSKESSVRRQVASMLSQQGTQNVDLLEKLSRDQDDMVASNALYGLADVGDDKSVEVLISMSREATRREDAIAALARSSHPRAETRLLELIHSGPPDQAAAAIRSSSSLSTESFENALREALQSKVPDVARAAAQSLDNRGLPLSGTERARVKALLESEAPHARNDGDDTVEDG